MHKGASALTTPLLDIRDLHVEADGSPVLHGVNLSIPIGETHVLFGPNGSGKSSLLATIMGLAPYRVTSGEIWFKGQRIDALPVDKRAQMRSEEHTSELQSLMRISYAVFCLKKK